MSGLRLLLRVTPIVLGAAAAAVWLRNERVERPMLPAPAEPARAEPADIEGAAIELESRPIDIVTVVDDLLLAGR
ncbi:MAG TPA: hypothetical protein VM824_04990 [Thermoleophilaceae bacterium]|jgi:hypothetical protein|nr:hypothetical protein [Thermoleophilaceae bacterium]